MVDKSAVEFSVTGSALSKGRRLWNYRSELGTGKEVLATAISTLLPPNQEKVQTVTFDNGNEFAQHDQIAECLQANV